jgi:hypothetical protein
MIKYQEMVPSPRWLILIGWAAAVGFGVGGLVYLLTGDPLMSERLALGLFFLAMAVLWVGVSLIFDHLRIEVGEDGVRVGYGPLTKTIRAGDLAGVEVEPYRWLVCGGWGIRFALGRRRAYSVPGCREGVALLLRNGVRYHVSSRNAESLAAALRQLVPDRPGRASTPAS